MKAKTNSQSALNSKGKRLATSHVVEEFERIMKLLSARIARRKERIAREKTKAKVDFEKALETSSLYTKSILSKPVLFEMQDEFCFAQGILLPDGKCFKVLAGSKASGIVDKKLPGDIRCIREELALLQVLVKDTVHGDMIFTRDYEFNNPSDAASTIAASLREGSHSWVAIENGKPMIQY